MISAAVACANAGPQRSKKNAAHNVAAQERTNPFFMSIRSTQRFLTPGNGEIKTTSSSTCHISFIETR
jgi:hypothetical protein